MNSEAAAHLLPGGDGGRLDAPAHEDLCRERPRSLVDEVVGRNDVERLRIDA